MAELTQTFLATDARGKTYQLHVITTRQHTPAIGGIGSRGETYKLVDDYGSPANRIDKGRYLLMTMDGDDVELTSSDPSAP